MRALSKLARRLRVAAVAALLALASTAAAEDVVIVVNPSNPAASVSRREASRYFLRQATEWPNGQRVQPVDQGKGSAARAVFAENVLGRSVADLDAFWSQAFYSGRAVPPPMKSGDAAVLDYVRANPGAIGYVSAGASLDGVKKITLRD